MRIFTKKNVKLKPSLKEALNGVPSQPQLEPSGILKFKKKSKSKAKLEESLKQTLLEWLEKMVTSQTSGKFKSYGVLKLILDSFQEGSGLRENNSHEADNKDVDTKDE